MYCFLLRCLTQDHRVLFTCARSLSHALTQELHQAGFHVDETCEISGMYDNDAMGTILYSFGRSCMEELGHARQSIDVVVLDEPSHHYVVKSIDKSAAIIDAVDPEHSLSKAVAAAQRSGQELARQSLVLA